MLASDTNQTHVKLAWLSWGVWLEYFTQTIRFWGNWNLSGCYWLVFHLFYTEESKMSMEFCSKKVLLKRKKSARSGALRASLTSALSFFFSLFSSFWLVGSDITHILGSWLALKVDQRVSSDIIQPSRKFWKRPLNEQRDILNRIHQHHRRYVGKEKQQKRKKTLP